MTPRSLHSEPVPDVVGIATIGNAGTRSAETSVLQVSSAAGRSLTAASAIAFAASKADPPPSETTACASAARTKAPPASTSSVVGFGCTSEKISTASPS